MAKGARCLPSRQLGIPLVEEANEKLLELESIGETNDPKLLDQKAILSNNLAVFYQSIDDHEQAIVFLQQAI